MVDIAGLDNWGYQKGKEQTILENHKVPENDSSKDREMFSEGDTTSCDSDSEYRMQKTMYIIQAYFPQS